MYMLHKQRISTVLNRLIKSIFLHLNQYKLGNRFFRHMPIKKISPVVEGLRNLNFPMGGPQDPPLFNRAWNLRQNFKKPHIS